MSTSRPIEDNKHDSKEFSGNTFNTKLKAILNEYLIPEKLHTDVFFKTLFLLAGTSQPSIKVTRESYSNGNINFEFDNLNSSQTLAIDKLISWAKQFTSIKYIPDGTKPSLSANCDEMCKNILPLVNDYLKNHPQYVTELFQFT